MKRKDNRHRRGMELVELALLIPVIACLTLGVIEYGNMLLRLQQITNVARQAARQAALADATSDQVKNTIEAMMTDAGVDSSGYTWAFSPGPPTSVPKGNTISVTVTLAYGVNGKSIFKTENMTYFPVPATISRTVTMSKEGP